MEDVKMKKLMVLGLALAVSGCFTSAPKETYPYGMNEKEWNELSIKDKAAIRRDFYFYERGNTNFVNPKLQVEGRTDTQNNIFLNSPKQQPQNPAPLIKE